MHPAEIVFGKHLKMPGDIISDAPDDREDLRIPTVQKYIAQLQYVKRIVSKNLKEAKDQQKEYADHHRWDVELSVGDYILLNARILSLRGGLS